MRREQLSYRELLNPKSRFIPILSPRYFPIHPSVYNSRFAYTPEFISEVLNSLQESVELDIRTIQKVLGFIPKYKQPELNLFHQAVNSEKPSIDFGFVGSNIGLQPGSYIEHIIKDDFDLPPLIKRYRAMIFSLRGDRLEVPSWYTHTPEENGMGVYLYLRNFAILFNNFGVLKTKS